MPRWSNFLLGFLLAILGWLTPIHAISPAFVPEEVTQIVAPASQATAAIRDQLTAYRPNGPPSSQIQQSLNPGVHRGIWVVVFDGDTPSAVVLQYAYCGGDPVNRWDPSGLDWVWAGGTWTETDPDRGLVPSPPPGFTPDLNGGSNRVTMKNIDNYYNVSPLQRNSAMMDGPDPTHVNPYVAMLGERIAWANSESMRMGLASGLLQFDNELDPNNFQSDRFAKVERFLHQLATDINCYKIDVATTDERLKNIRNGTVLRKNLALMTEIGAPPMFGGQGAGYSCKGYGSSARWMMQNSRNSGQGLQQVTTGRTITPDNVVDSSNDWVTRIPKGSRPHPAKYLSVAERQAHAAMFEGGVVRIGPSAPTGTIGRTETWVMPRSTADRLISQAKGDVATLERALGLNPGDLGTAPIRVDIPSPKSLRLPTGNEFGANNQWIPGGRTSGGIPEAIIDPVPVGSYSTSPVFGE